MTWAKRWLKGTTSRKANRTCTPGSATRSSPSSSCRLRSRRSFSVSSRPEPVCGSSTIPAGAYPCRVAAWDDDDDWVGEPPEGHYSRDRADPAFWRGMRPFSITAAGIGIALLILVVVIVLH